MTADGTDVTDGSGSGMPEGVLDGQVELLTVWNLLLEWRTSDERRADGVEQASRDLCGEAILECDAVRLAGAEGAAPAGKIRRELEGTVLTSIDARAYGF